MPESIFPVRRMVKSLRYRPTLTRPPDGKVGDRMLYNFRGSLPVLGGRVIKMPFFALYQQIYGRPRSIPSNVAVFWTTIDILKTDMPK